MSDAPREDFTSMSLGDHLDDLRRRAIYALIGVAVASIVTFTFGLTLVQWLMEPLAAVLREQGLPGRTIALKLTTGFGVYMKVSLIAALVVAAPWLLYQAWRFVAAGLYRSEQRMVMLLTPLSAVMTVLGVMFAYFIMLPMSLIFFIGFTSNYPQARPGGNLIVDAIAAPIRQFSGLHDQPKVTHPIVEPAAINAGSLPMLARDPDQPAEGQVWINLTLNELKVHFNGVTRALPLSMDTLMSPQIEASGYISFVLSLILGIVVAFQVPVVLLVLGMTGLVEPKVIAKSRRYVVFAMFVLAAFLTPADPISMFVLGLPLWGLFELGLLFMKLADARRAGRGAGRSL